MYKGCPKKTVTDPWIFEQRVNVSWQPCSCLVCFILKKINEIHALVAEQQWYEEIIIHIHTPNTAVSMNIDMTLEHRCVIWYYVRHGLTTFQIVCEMPGAYQNECLNKRMIM